MLVISWGLSLHLKGCWYPGASWDALALCSQDTFPLPTGSIYNELRTVSLPTLWALWEWRLWVFLALHMALQEPLLSSLNEWVNEWVFVLSNTDFRDGERKNHTGTINITVLIIQTNFQKKTFLIKYQSVLKSILMCSCERRVIVQDIPVSMWFKIFLNE